MTNSLLHAFFLGRATAEVISEKIENSLMDVLSEIGKFDAEQREKLRQFTTQVLDRANQSESVAAQSQTTTPSSAGSRPADLQATIDELRAEIARLRSELQQHRNRAA